MDLLHIFSLFPLKNITNLLHEYALFKKNVHHALNLHTRTISQHGYLSVLNTRENSKTMHTKNRNYYLHHTHANNKFPSIKCKYIYIYYSCKKKQYLKIITKFNLV